MNSDTPKRSGVKSSRRFAPWDEAWFSALPKRFKLAWFALNDFSDEWGYVHLSNAELQRLCKDETISLDLCVAQFGCDHLYRFEVNSYRLVRDNEIP